MEICKRIGAREDFGIGLGEDFNPRTTPNSPNLETRPVFRKRIRPFLVKEFHRYQEPWVCWIAVIRISYLRKVELIPMMWAIGLYCIALVDVVNTIAKWICGATQLPGEYARAIRRVGHRRRIIAPRCCRSVHADQPVLGPHLPVIIRAVLVAGQAGEKTFGARTEACRPDWPPGHGDKVLGSRKNERV